MCERETYQLDLMLPLIKCFSGKKGMRGVGSCGHLLKTDQPGG